MSNCENDLRPAVTWCMNCTESLCRNCNEMHKKLKGLKSHKTIPIVLWNQSSKHAKGDTQVEKEFCLYHTDRTLDLYCKTCSSLICRDCNLKDHSHGHDFDFVDEVMDEEREDETGHCSTETVARTSKKWSREN